MPRIIFISALTLWSMGKGHGGPAFTQTVQKYLQEGWDVYLISDVPDNAAYPNMDASHNLVLDRSPFYRLSRIRKLGRIFQVLNYYDINHQFAKTAAKLVKASAKDTIIYAYECDGLSGAKWVARNYHLPLVTRFQGTLLGVIPYHPLMNRIKEWISYLGLSCPADLIIMTDDGSFGDRVLKRLGNTSPTMFWKNGLELLELNFTDQQKEAMRRKRRSALGFQEEDLMLLTVSRLVGWKRVERSIYGLKQCADRLPNAWLVIVGDGTVRSDLEALTASLGLQDRVIFTGSVPHDETYSYMAAADIFLSLYDRSNVGNPLLEAMTLGKCIVTLDVGNTRAEVHHGENGILMTYETLDHLGDVLTQLGEDPELRRRLGETAAAYAKAHYWTWKARMDAELEQVKKLLG